MPRNVSCQWMLVLGWLGVAIAGARAGMPDLERSAEFRFGDQPWEAWRLTRPLAERFLPPAEPWVRAGSASGRRQAFLGNRVAVRLRAGARLPAARIRELGLAPGRDADNEGGVRVFQARDAWAAATAAMALAREPSVEQAAPVLRRDRALHGGFGPRPRDPLFRLQWHLENRDAEGGRLGPDLNPRAAWPWTRGEGVTIGFGDTGFETDHPDLAAAAAGAPHRDFVRGAPGAAVYGDHGTLVAGLAGARGDNGIGVVGVAPRVKMAGWTLFDTRSGFGWTATDEDFAEMCVYRNDLVPVQSHSWGIPSEPLFPPSLPEVPKLTEALEQARGGLGIVMVRSAGNLRKRGVNANDDGYANDPRVIAVAAIGKDGKAATYSNPGACLLVGAPSSDDSDPVSPTPGITTTDRMGSLGWNSGFYSDDFASYATNFDGTSAAAPQVAGVVALMLSVNPLLSVRDVQQVLIHASQPWNLADPQVRTNGAGYRVSHDEGFGVPDAGVAVRLARDWKPRPPLARGSARQTGTLSVPDDGLRLWVRGTNGIEEPLRCELGPGMHPDEPTAAFPLVFVGRADAELAVDLRGKAALVERGGGLFSEKVDRAARAGAGMVVIYNHIDGTTLVPPLAVDHARIPVATITENAGRTLVKRLANGEPVGAQLRIQSVAWTFAVTQRMACEHVGLRVRASHRHRGDLRIVLRSPSGTWSVMQALGTDTEAGPTDWTYWSTQHFYEPSAGTWTVSFADELAGTTGTILEAELLLRGTALEDADADGLDDGWEQQWLGGLGSGPRDDPDQDGSSNAREQVLGTDPLRAEAGFRLSLDPWDPDGRLRLGWPANAGSDYRILQSAVVGGEGQEVVRLPGRFPAMDWVAPRPGEGSGFWRVESIPGGPPAP